jgi:flagellar basal-body rod modification protein FlgD
MSSTIPDGYTSISNLPVYGSSGTSGAASTGSTGSTGSSGAATSSGSSLDEDAFLQLLVAQLKYQDPSQPVDSSQFMSQTAQFTQVQKMDEMTKATESVLALQQGLAASALVGKTVQYTLPDGTSGSGTALSASFGVASQAEPTIRVGSQDIPLSSVTTVGEPR